MMPQGSRARRPKGRVRKRQRWRVAEAQNWRCAHCAAALEPATATLDHVIPLSRGGADDYDNHVAACFSCNQSRANFMPAYSVNGSAFPVSLVARAA
jgi:5-methylcytosine-specific restriction endonuclease McrA